MQQHEAGVAGLVQASGKRLDLVDLPVGHRLACLCDSNHDIRLPDGLLRPRRQVRVRHVDDRLEAALQVVEPLGVVIVARRA